MLRNTVSGMAVWVHSILSVGLYLSSCNDESVQAIHAANDNSEHMFASLQKLMQIIIIIWKGKKMRAELIGNFRTICRIDWKYVHFDKNIPISLAVLFWIWRRNYVAEKCLN